MEDEFDKLMELLSLEAAEKEAKLDDIFQRSMDFFNRFKHVQQHGSKEEIQQMKMKLEKMYKKIQQETSKTVEKSGLTEEQIKEIASNPIHFSPKQWEFLQLARSKLEEQNKQIADQNEIKKSQRSEALSEAKKNHKTKKKDWLRS
jgi:hypothetical protein